MLTRRRLLTGLGLSLLALPRRSQAVPLLRPSTHPLNHPARCTGWWLASPLAGHAYWADLIHRHVAITEGVQAGYGLQRSTLRTGGLGEVRFNGDNDLVLLPPLLDNPPRLSISCWFQTSSPSNQGLLTKMPSYTGNLGWYLVQHTGGTLGFWVQESGSAYVGVYGNEGWERNDGQWHHVVVTMAGWTASQIALTVDGQPYSVAPLDVGVVSTVSNTEPIRLGNFGDGSNPFIGSLDDVRLAPVVWSTAEIRTLFLAPQQDYRPLLTAPPPLVVKAPVTDTTTRPRGLLFQ